MPLREYQQRTHDSLYEYFATHEEGHPILPLPTGAGKSHILAAFIQSALAGWPTTRLAVMSHVKEIVEQDLEKVAPLLPKATLGVCSAGLGKKQTQQPVIFGSVGTMVNCAAELGHRDMVLIDEAHTVPHKQGGRYWDTLDQLWDINPRMRVVGLTATPFRTNGGWLHKGDARLFTDLLPGVEITELLREGWLSPLVPRATANEVDTTGLSIVNGDFKSADLDEYMTEPDRIRSALDEACELGKDRKSWLVFCCTIRHAIAVMMDLRQRGIEAACITGQTDLADRRQRIRDFKNGDLKCLVNVNVLTTGFDAPRTDLIIGLRPTCSPVLHVQMAGRGMRLSPETGKENCLYLDFSGNVVRHGPLNALKIRDQGDRKYKPREAADTKTCPECQTIQSLENELCELCGFEFPLRESAHATTSGNTELVVMDTAPKLVQIAIDAVELLRHQKQGKPDSVRVNYLSGWTVYSSWVCPDHPGFAANKAVSWWTQRTGETLTAEQLSANYVLENVERVRAPAAISVLVDPTGKEYPSVKQELEEAAVAGLVRGDGNVLMRPDEREQELEAEEPPF
ncbi:MAG: DEAD/DEAH box helicase family protein [bacterium]|nr:DEAD/DEAH box helicase family protein [bacterium]